MIKKFTRIISFALLLTILTTSLNLGVYAQNTKVINNISNESANELAKNIYNNLSAEAKNIFIDYLELEALKGNDKLLQFHKTNIDKSYISNSKSILFPLESQTSTLKMASAADIATQIKALDLPTAVEYGLTAFAAALGVPVGNVVDVAVGLGLAVIIAIYWDDIKDQWDDIVEIFTSTFSSIASEIKEAFDFLKSEAKDIEKDYEKAKEDGKETDNHSETTDSSLPTKNQEPFSSKDKVRDGKVIQRRYYDKEGRADLDIDYTNHGNPVEHPKVPHRHDWDWTKTPPRNPNGY